MLLGCRVLGEDCADLASLHCRGLCARREWQPPSHPREQANSFPLGGSGSVWQPGPQRSLQDWAVLLSVPHAQKERLEDRHHKRLLESVQVQTMASGGTGSSHQGWDYVP